VSTCAPIHPGGIDKPLDRGRLTGALSGTNGLSSLDRPVSMSGPSTRSGGDRPPGGYRTEAPARRPCAPPAKHERRRRVFVAGARHWRFVWRSVSRPRSRAG
jgi:hypothetical protein